jgi:hypothetical protein
MRLQLPKQLRLLQGSDQLQKKNKQRDFIDKCTLGDVFVDATKPKVLKGSKETMSLQSINGVCPNMLGAYTLRLFMINNKLQNDCGKSKGEMWAMIVERKKIENSDQIMYGEDFDEGKGDGKSKKKKMIIQGG